MNEKAKKKPGLNKRVAPKKGLDFYPTPLWATRALLEHALRFAHGKFLDPCAGLGAMVRALGEYGEAHGQDIVDYANGGVEVAGGDWLADDWCCPSLEGSPDWVIMNPPFNDSLKFIRTAFRRFPRAGLAVLQRVHFLEGRTRAGTLFAQTPPNEVWVFPSRVNVMRGKLQRKTAAIVFYIWVIWKPGGAEKTELCWFPVDIRERLERRGDYGADDEVKFDRPGEPRLAL